MCVLSPRAGQNALPRQCWAWAVAGFDEGRVDLTLEVGTLWQTRGDQRGCVIICHRGAVWITQERDVLDYVLEEGDIFIVTLPGLVLVQAREPASVTIVTPSIWAKPYVGDYRAFR